MSILVYMSIEFLITFSFGYALFIGNLPIAIATFVAGFILSQWYSKEIRK